MNKLYIKNLDQNLFYKKCHSNFYKITENTFVSLYSDSGIYKIENNTLYKINFKNQDIKKIFIQNQEIWIDLSESYYKKIFSQFPNNYIPIRQKLIKYKFNDFKDYYFCILFEENNIIDTYVEFKDSYNSQNQQFIISSFLSL
tara:strand:- start:4357 stop:4785 length:429 start_codon:yes stop_codon:yes gene_type:complete